MHSAQIKELLQKIPSGYKNPCDEFFDSATKTSFIPSYKKLGVISTEEPALEAPSASTHSTTSSFKEIYCNVPSCRRFFDSVAAYQTHFNTVHRYICAQCSKSLPTPHLLDLHISEQHDSYFAARLERGEPMYTCLLEECKLRLHTQEERRDHCITVHKFPSDFRFDQVSRKVSSGGREQHKHEVNSNDVLCGDLGGVTPTNKSKKQTNFAFGHQKQKTFDTKHRKKNVNKKPTVEGETLEDLQGLKQALENI